MEPFVESSFSASAVLVATTANFNESAIGVDANARVASVVELPRPSPPLSVGVGELDRAAVVVDVVVPVGEGCKVVPEVSVEACVAVGVGVRVAVAATVCVVVGLLVFASWTVAVLVIVAEGGVVCVTVAVDVGKVFGWAVAVAVAGGGAVTVKDPELVESGIGLPLGSVAIALLNDKVDEPGEAPIFTLTTTLATVPFWIAVWFNPKMSTRTRPEEGVDQERVFPADEAVPPMVTF